MMGDVVRFLKMTEHWEDALRQVHYREGTIALARRDDVSVADEELQDAVDSFREEIGLLRASETQAWLSERDLELEDLERGVEARLLEEKLCSRLADRDVEERFHRERIRFDQIRLRAFRAKDAASGQALAEHLRKGMSFCDPWALEKCSDRHMHWGWFLRDELPMYPVASQVFRAAPGDVVGPLPLEEGEEYGVYYVEAMRPALMSSDNERQIRLEIIAEQVEDILQPDNPMRFVMR